jgi:hypothetical protein
MLLLQCMLGKSTGHLDHHHIDSARILLVGRNLYRNLQHWQQQQIGDPDRFDPRLPPTLGGLSAYKRRRSSYYGHEGIAQAQLPVAQTQHWRSTSFQCASDRRRFEPK